MASLQEHHLPRELGGRHKTLSSPHGPAPGSVRSDIRATMPCRKRAHQLRIGWPAVFKIIRQFEGHGLNTLRRIFLPAFEYGPLNKPTNSWEGEIETKLRVKTWK